MYAGDIFSLSYSASFEEKHKTKETWSLCALSMLLTASDSIRHGGLEGYLFVSKASSLGKGRVMGELFAYVLTKALAATLHSRSLPHLTNVQMNPFVPSTDRQPEGQGCKPGEERTGMGHMGRAWKAEMGR